MSIEFDIEELAYRAMGSSEEQAEEKINNGDIDESLIEKYDIGFDTYCEIVKDLLPFTQVLQSAITKTRFHAFVDNEQQRAIVKIDAKQRCEEP